MRSLATHPVRPVTRRRRLGATATEYMLILALVVLPLGALLPLFVKTIRLYGLRVTGGLQLPFP